jgi:hypothetical protein
MTHHTIPSQGDEKRAILASRVSSVSGIISPAHIFIRWSGMVFGVFHHVEGVIKALNGVGWLTILECLHGAPVLLNMFCMHKQQAK